MKMITEHYSWRVGVYRRDGYPTADAARKAALEWIKRTGSAYGCWAEITRYPVSEASNAPTLPPTAKGT